MKVSLLQENLKLALIQLQKAIPTKPQLPILSSVLFSVFKSEMIISATDLYLGIRVKVQGQIQEVGKIAVPGEILRQLISSLPPGKIELSTTEKSLIIKTATTRTQIPYQSGEEFPEFPEVAGVQIELSVLEMKTMVEQVNYAISTDASRPVLTAMLLKFSKKNLEVVGTDGFRLAVVDLPPRQNVQDLKVLLPAKTVQEVNRIVQQSKIEAIICQIDTDLKQVKFIVDGTDIFVRMIEGEFPPYEKIIPTEFSTQVLFDGPSLLAELKRAVFFARETSNIVRMTLNQDSLAILSRSPSYGEYQSQLAAKGKVPASFEVAFNANYMIDFLLAQGEVEISLEANESLKPIMLSTVGSTAQKYIVMPFRVSDLAI